MSDHTEAHDDEPSEDTPIDLEVQNVTITATSTIDEE